VVDSRSGPAAQPTANPRRVDSYNSSHLCLGTSFDCATQKRLEFVIGHGSDYASAHYRCQRLFARLAQDVRTIAEIRFLQLSLARWRAWAHKAVMRLDAYDLDTAHGCYECTACGKTVNMRDLCDRGLSVDGKCPDCEHCVCDESVSKCGYLDESGHCAQCVQEEADEFVANVDIYALNARAAERLQAQHDKTIAAVVQWVKGGVP